MFWLGMLNIIVNSGENCVDILLSSGKSHLLV